MAKGNVSTRKKGDIGAYRNEVMGPFSIFLKTGRLNDDGTLVMQEYEQLGVIKQREELEEESFTDGIYFRKHYLTPEMEDELRSMRMSDEFSDVLDVPTGELEVIPGAFDEIEETIDGEKTGKTVQQPRTRPVYEKRRLSTRHLNASLHTLVRIVGKWDLHVDGELIPLEVDAIRKAGIDSDIINAILDKHREITNPPRA